MLIINFLAHVEMRLVVTEALLVQVVVEYTITVNSTKLLVWRNKRIHGFQNIAHLLVGADLDLILLFEIVLGLLDLVQCFFLQSLREGSQIFTSSLIILFFAPAAANKEQSVPQHLH